MRGDQRPDASPTPIQQYEDHAHDHVADKAADALVEVVRAAQHRARRERRHRGPPELPQPPQQVADDDDLLDHGVLHGRGDQHRHLPPHAGQRLRHDREVEARRPRAEVQQQAATADDRRHADAAAQVESGPAPVEADRPQAAGPLAQQQMRHQCHGDERGGDAEQLPRQIEPRAARRLRGVHHRGLVLETARLGQRPDEADERRHAAGAERERQDQQCLVAQEPPRQPAVRAVPPASVRLLPPPARGSRTGHGTRVRLHSCLQFRTTTFRTTAVSHHRGPPVGASALERHSLPDAGRGRAVRGRRAVQEGPGGGHAESRRDVAHR